MIEIKSEEIKLVDIDKIIINPRNTNKHSDEQIERLSKLIKYNGFRDPLIISNRSGFLICGHARKKAALLLGITELPVIYQDFKNEAEEFQFMTAHNAIARWAELDNDLILSGVDEFKLDDLDLLGIADFKLPVVEVIGECDEDEIPEVKEAIVKLGDVWLLGNHRVMCGDSTMIDSVEKLMNGEKADMVFTDPPYNVASESTNMASDVSKSMKDLKNSEWDKNFEIEPPIINAINFSKDSATYYIFTSHWLFQKIMEVLKEYCDFSGYLVWSKPNPMPSLMKRHPTWNTELCCYGTRGSKRIVNFPKDGHFLSCREVIKKSDGSHPTQKPQELIVPLIEFSSGKNQLILDLFLGSGSTLIACEKTNRKCYGMELDPKYCDVIINRWQKFTGKEAALESTGESYNSLKNKNISNEEPVAELSI